MAGVAMKSININRRKFLFGGAACRAGRIGRRWEIRRAYLAGNPALRLNGGQLGFRFVHFSDVHHKGDRAYLHRVVDKINSLHPDFSCFTGDLIEESHFCRKRWRFYPAFNHPCLASRAIMIIGAGRVL